MTNHDEKYILSKIFRLLTNYSNRIKLLENRVELSGTIESSSPPPLPPPLPPQDNTRLFYIYIQSGSDGWQWEYSPKILDKGKIYLYIDINGNFNLLDGEDNSPKNGDILSYTYSNNQSGELTYVTYSSIGTLQYIQINDTNVKNVGTFNHNNPIFTFPLSSDQSNWQPFTFNNMALTTLPDQNGTPIMQLIIKNPIPTDSKIVTLPDLYLRYVRDYTGSEPILVLGCTGSARPDTCRAPPPCTCLTVLPPNKNIPFYIYWNVTDVNADTGNWCLFTPGCRSPPPPPTGVVGGLFLNFSRLSGNEDTCPGAISGPCYKLTLDEKPCNFYYDPTPSRSWLMTSYLPDEGPQPIYWGYFPFADIPPHQPGYPGPEPWSEGNLWQLQAGPTNEVGGGPEIYLVDSNRKEDNRLAKLKVYLDNTNLPSPGGKPTLWSQRNTT